MTRSNRFAIAKCWRTCRSKPPLRVLDLVERYHATGEALEECGRLVRTLEIQRYGGDYAL
jgi:hypothetical protein